MWTLIIDSLSTSHMLNVCVCVVPFSQASSRYLAYPLRDILYLIGKRHKMCVLLLLQSLRVCIFLMCTRHCKCSIGSTVRPTDK